MTNQTGKVVGFARVSELDLPRVAEQHWCLRDPGGDLGNGANYVMARIRGGGGGKGGYTRLHIYLLRPNRGQHIDHIDGDRTNCRRENLRLVTKKQNADNRGVSSNSSTKIRNVILLRSGPNAGRYFVKVAKDYVVHHGGYFDNIEDAASAAEQLRAQVFTHHNEDRSRA